MPAAAKAANAAAGIGFQGGRVRLLGVEKAPGWPKGPCALRGRAARGLARRGSCSSRRRRLELGPEGEHKRGLAREGKAQRALGQIQARLHGKEFGVLSSAEGGERRGGFDDRQGPVPGKAAHPAACPGAGLGWQGDGRQGDGPLLDPLAGAGLDGVDPELGEQKTGHGRRRRRRRHRRVGRREGGATGSGWGASLGWQGACAGFRRICLACSPQACWLAC
mmetsp:Transcript_63466/g.143149  ORF Transcript_63466/g.143149 Transcript_63466/m.143149 type:complete len:221 (+) Transcript_63466:1395-2057(+)